MNSDWATYWTAEGFLFRFPTIVRDLFPPESVQNGSVAQIVTNFNA